MNALLLAQACVPAFEEREAVDWDGDGVLGASDCDDDRPDVYPGAPELCDGLDNDCDGSSACDAAFAGFRLTAGPGHAGLGLGASLLVPGDVDGDGVNDFLAGAPTADANVPVDSDAGQIALFSGAGGSLLSLPAGVGTSALTGAALAAAGDVDGDGRADAWVGAPGFEGNGRIYLLAGEWLAAASVDLGAAAILEGAAGERLGTALVAVGSTLVGGAPEGDGGLGALRTWADPYGSPETTAGVDPAGRLGSALCAADVDGDGAPEVLAGIPGAGAIAILDLPIPAGDADAARWTGEGLGSAIAAGDLDGDGTADAVAGGGGTLWIFPGGPGAPGGGDAATRSEARIDAPTDGVLAAVGDVDGDDAGELAVGSPGEDREIQLFDSTRLDPDCGAVWLVSGPWVGVVPLEPGLQEYLGSSLYDGLGAALAGAGDLDGDGRADLAIGAPGYSGGEGAVYAVQGDSFP